MTWLRNAWYAAGLAKELDGSEMVGRTLLGLPVLLYHDADANAVAIGNRCPHRFAPLHRGKLTDGIVSCGYHGLGFDRSGACVHNPHGPIGKLSVPNYPLIERYGILWIWMGNPELTDPSQIPRWDCFDPKHYHVGSGYLHGSAHYELMTDNILDLSHVEFLHPALGTDKISQAKVVTDLESDVVVTTRRMHGEVLPPNLAQVYRTSSRPVNRTMQVRWQAPSNLLLTVSVETVDDQAPWSSASFTAHLFTPESKHSTHYFYLASLAREKADVAVHAAFLAALSKAFVTEDKAMIDAQQVMIGDAEIMQLGPALLPIDKAAVLARRALGKKIQEEAMQ